MSNNVAVRRRVTLLGLLIGTVVLVAMIALLSSPRQSPGSGISPTAMPSDTPIGVSADPLLIPIRREADGSLTPARISTRAQTPLTLALTMPEGDLSSLLALYRGDEQIGLFGACRNYGAPTRICEMSLRDLALDRALQGLTAGEYRIVDLLSPANSLELVIQ